MKGWEGVGPLPQDGVAAQPNTCLTCHTCLTCNCTVLALLLGLLSHTLEALAPCLLTTCRSSEGVIAYP